VRAGEYKSLFDAFTRPRRPGYALGIGAPTDPGESAAEPTTAAATDERVGVPVEISNAVVRIHKKLLGKGPVKARTYLASDVVTVILEGGFTRSEETLTERGHEETVEETRQTMKEAVEGEFRAAIESILHRSVHSFMSANDPATELQAEIFVLAPRGSEDAV
jgi:uncharacterized protein YbcI